MKEFKGTKELELAEGMLVGEDILICEMIDYSEENKANSRLFLASYELLEALQESQKLLAELGTIKSGEAYYKNMKAINKALNGK